MTEPERQRGAAAILLVALAPLLAGAEAVAVVVTPACDVLG